MGLAYFGGLWLTVAGVARRPSSVGLVPASMAARFVLLALGFRLISSFGASSMLAALAGVWLARGYLVARLGAKEVGHGK
jgi:F1F0 ATPase subunit 2